MQHVKAQSGNLLREMCTDVLQRRSTSQSLDPVCPTRPQDLGSYLDEHRRIIVLDTYEWKMMKVVLARLKLGQL